MWQKFLAIFPLIANANFQQYPLIINFPVEYYQIQGIPLQSKQETINLASCRIAFRRLCPDPEIKFYLYTQKYADNPEPIRIGSDPFVTNLTDSAFNPNFPTKIILHGYNSDMNLGALVEIRKQYMATGEGFNVIAIDWSPLAQGPCYPAAVWNTRHVGQCTAQLIERIRELQAENIHVIGFSLGAHVTNYMANHLRPYQVPRITGLDPALPGFVTASNENKLDKSDAEFVDVVHTNAFIQGKVEESGHVDFYLNGGVIQPGCWAENRFFACNHHRAPLYFAESINTKLGFWGWPCRSYLTYLLGSCPPVEPQILMGEKIDRNSRGMHLVITNSIAPFADGKFTGPAIEILYKSEKNRVNILRKFRREVEQLIGEDEMIEKVYQTRNYTSLYKVFGDSMFCCN